MAKKVTIEGSGFLERTSQGWGGIGDGTQVYGTTVPFGVEWGVNRGEVERFIKEQFGNKVGEIYYDSSITKYLCFSDAESRDLYLSDPTTYADLLIGSFDAPANYTAEITMISSTDNTTLVGTDGCFIVFTFDIVNKTGASAGDSVTATFTFNNSGNKKVVTQIYNAGDTVRFLADPYLLEGRNTITVTITGRTTLAATTVAVLWTVVDLQLSSTFDMTQSYSSVVSVPFELRGAGVKYIEWHIDGQLVEDYTAYTDASLSRVKDLSIAALEDGKHSVELMAYIQSGSEKFYSRNLYFDFVKGNASLTTVLLGLTLDDVFDGAITAVQYQDTEIAIALYDSQARELPVTISEDGEPIQSLTMATGELEVFTYTPLATGTHTLTFTVLGNVTTLSVSVEESTIGISEATDGMVLKLSAKGRSNSETHPETWTYGSYSADMTGFLWNSQSGWDNGALIIQSGASVSVNISPFAQDVKSTGVTVEIDYETVQVDNENASVIDLMNEDSGAGILLTASTAKLASSGGNSVDTKYRSGDRIHISFIVNRLQGSDARYLFIVNNGILERAARYESGDVFLVQDNLRIAPVGCTVKLYSIRIYNRNLTVEEAFCNYAIDAPDMLNIVNKNDIFDGLGRIDADKVNANIPIMIITGDMSAVFNATNKNAESRADVEYIDLQDPTKSFTGTDIKWKPQGTSSLGYPRKNLRMYTNGYPESRLYDYLGERLGDGLYAFKDKAQPVNCWTLKADYAESSGSHNTGVARLWNDLMYYAQVNGQYVLRTNAQNAALLNGYGYDVRTTVDGFPIVVFWRETPTSELVCMGQYNFNNDKSTESVFGFKDIFVDGVKVFDASNVQCFEFLDSANPIALFTDVSNFDSGWDAAWESRYPDTKTPNLAPLKALATWINSCKNNQSKWNSEKAQHFDLPKLAAYYVYLMRFGAVDQTVKNAMITTEDGVHWYFINYDNDTIFGIDNDSDVLNAWNYTRQTLRSGSTYYYAGHESVLWNCFEADPECMALVKTVDNALFTVGLTYARLCQMFDSEQCDKWCERIYNDNGRYKYIDVNQVRYLKMLQGSRKSYRHWWLEHRMDMYDALWGTGAFRSRVIQFKCEQTTESKVGKTFIVGSGIDTYFGYGFNNDVTETGVFIPTSQPHTFTFQQDFNIGSPVNLFNANNIETIDLSSLIDSLASIDLNKAIGNDGVARLKRLVLGDASHSNASGNLPVIEGLTKMDNIEEIDIRGFQGLTSLDLSNAHNLHVVRAARSGLTSFAPASGVGLTEVSLPSTLGSLTLDSATVASLTYTPTTTLRSVTLRNVTGSWDVKSFVNTWLVLLSESQLAQAELTLTNINWSGMAVEQLLRLGKAATFNTQGATTLHLSGSVTLSSITFEEFQQIVDVFGANVFRSNSVFRIIAPAGMFIAGPTSLHDNQTDKYTAVAFGSDGDIIYYMYNGSTIVPSQTDSQGRVFRKLGSVTLYEATGDVVIDGNLSTSTTVNIRARIRGTATYSDTITLVASPFTYPTIAFVSGIARIRRIGTYNFPFTVTGTSDDVFLRREVSITSQPSVASVSLSGNAVVLDVISIPEEEACTITLSYVYGNKTINATYEVSITSSSVIMTTESNAPVLAICYQQGWCANPDKMTEEEASNVTDIGRAFNNSSITHFEEFEFFNGLTAIQSSAFYTCRNLTIIVLPEGIRTIGSSAFNNCNRLETVIINDGVTSIESNSFFNCQQLSYIRVPSTVTSIGTQAFYSDTLLRTAGPIGGGYNYEFGWETEIPSYAFASFSLQSIELPNTITTIGSNAFYNANLQSVILPNSVTTIGLNAFLGNSNLEYIRIPSSATNFSGVYFAGNSKLTTAGPIGGGYNVEFGWTDSIPNFGLANLYYLTSITFPNTITSIGNSAFSNTQSLDSITIPNSVTSIGQSAFSACGASTITLPNGLTSIGGDCFYNSKISSIVFPNTITSWGSTTCRNCKSLTSVTLPNTMQDVVYGMFSGCSSLASIEIPNGVTTISERAFQDCTALQSVNLPSSLLSIGEYVFLNCTSLVSVTIPNSVTTIGRWAFSNCTALESIVIGSGVTTIGTWMLSGCGSVSYIKVLSENLEDVGIYLFDTRYAMPTALVTAGPIGGGYDIEFVSTSLPSIFGSITSLTTVTLPNSITKIGNSAFYSCSNLTSIVIHEGVTSIGNYAFNGCSSLTSVTIPESVTSIGSQAFSGCGNVATLTIKSSCSLPTWCFRNLVKLSIINCLSMTANALESSAFDNIGTDSSVISKSLNVRAGATGYQAGYWLTKVINAGYVYNETL